MSKLLSLSDGQMMRIRQEAKLLPSTTRSHFLELVAARVGPNPSDAYVEQTARMVTYANLAITNDKDFRIDS